MGILSDLKAGTSQSQNTGYTLSTSSGWSKTDGTGATNKAIDAASTANATAYDAWKAAAEYNAEEAQKQRDWQEKMANSQYQRAVQDMIKAGINPILAASNGISGAGVGSGSTASMTTPSTYMANTFADSSSANSANSVSKNEGWSKSESSLAQGLGLMGQYISQAINTLTNSKGLESAMNELGVKVNDSAKEVTQKVIDSIESVLPFATTDKKYNEELNPSTKQLDNLDEYLNHTTLQDEVKGTKDKPFWYKKR